MLQQNLKVENLRAKQWPRFSFTTAAEKQLKHRNHWKKQYFLVVGLEKVVFKEGNCQGNRKLRADPA